MKVAPVSADLLIKLALIAGGVGLAWYAYTQIKTGLENVTAGAGKAARQVADATITAVNPASEGNLVNRGVSGLGGWISGNDNWNLGGWIYDITHPNTPTTQGLPEDFTHVPSFM